MQELLKQVTTEVAVMMEMPPEKVRSNIFALHPDGLLRIVEGLANNMRSVGELTIAIPPGQGSTGSCFALGKPYISVFKSVLSDSTIVAESERTKAHRDLKWIISVPLLARVPDVGAPFGVLNVDGLLSRTKEQLGRTVPGLLYWSEFISLLVGEADDGRAVASEQADAAHYEVEVLPAGEVTSPSKGFASFIERHGPVLPVRSRSLEEFRVLVERTWAQRSSALAGPDHPSVVGEHGTVARYIAHALVYPDGRVYLPEGVLRDLQLARSQVEIYRVADSVLLRRDVQWDELREALAEELTDAEYGEVVAASAGELDERDTGGAA